MRLKRVHFRIKMQTVELVNLTCVTNGLFYDQGTRSVSFEVKNDVFQIDMFDINVFVL